MRRRGLWWAALTALVLATPAARAQHRLDVIEIRTGGAQADEPLPLIVALHGRGDRPEHFAGLFKGLPVKARVVLARAPLPFGEGGSWYRTRRECKGSMHAYGKGIEDAVQAVARLTRQLVQTYPTDGRPIITGFSQGGLLSFLLAVRHPDLWRAALPIAGEIPTALLPRPPVLGSPTPPIRAFHGLDDRVFPVAATEGAVQDLVALGFDATLQTYEGLGHRTNAALQRDLFAAIQQALAPLPTARE